MNSLENIALTCLEESLVPSPFKFARGKSKFVGNGTKDEEIGSELDAFNKLTTKRQPLLGKYLEAHSGSDVARGKCVGFCTYHGYPYLILEDGNGTPVLISCDKMQRKIYEFTPSGGEVTGMTGTGSSDNPALYSMSKKNY
jgi:hypothetical protein